MGTKGRAIIKLDADQLVSLLNKAFADEWLAYYQYWVGAAIVKGPMKEAAIAELTEHAADELRHAQMLSDRIIQLGGTPITDPNDWSKTSNCAYANPSDPYITAIIEQGIEGEQCAIDVYTKLLDLTEGKDPITYQMVLSILQDEVDHEEDFQALLEDLEEMKKRR
jgi:bacterioferritin